MYSLATVASLRFLQDASEQQKLAAFPMGYCPHKILAEVKEIGSQAV